MEETVLVTGGCGFIGHRMVSALRVDGHSVRVLDIPRADFACTEDLGAKAMKGSTVDAESVQRALGSSKVVFHLAAPNTGIRDDKFIRKMVVAGTEVLMEEAEDSQVEHVVAASTTGVYTRTQGVHDEDAPLKPGNRLEQAKAHMERVLEKAVARTGIGVTVLRLANVYGALDGAIIEKLVPEVVYEGSVILPEIGLVSCVHVDDTVDAARRLADSARAMDGEGEGTFRVFNCVDDRSYTPRGLLDAIADVTGSQSPTIRKPGFVGSTKGKWVDRKHGIRLVERGSYSNEAIKGVLAGWPRWPSLEDGLQDELERDGA